MSHNMVTGMTGSGKSLLSQTVCSRLKAQGIKTGVLDPLNDPAWDCDLHTSDSEEFLKWCKANQNCVLFVDESGETVGRFNVEMQWLVTQSRHWGHSCFMICQALAQVSPIVRQQCSTFMVFGTSDRNFALLKEETNVPEIDNFKNLAKLHFIKVSRFKPLEKGVIKIPGDGKVSLDKIDIIYDVVSTGSSEPVEE